MRVPPVVYISCVLHPTCADGERMQKVCNYCATGWTIACSAAKTSAGSARPVI